MLCCAIEYFSRDPFGVELQDATFAIPCEYDDRTLASSLQPQDPGYDFSFVC